MGRVIVSSDLWIGMSLYALAFLWLILVIAHMRISQFYPLAVGLNILLTVGAGIWVLGETVTFGRVIGIMLILSGVILVAR